MNMSAPRPGYGYFLREYLGGGRWKEVWRAVVQSKMSDVALLVYAAEGAEKQGIIDEVSPVLRIRRESYSEYVAVPHDIFQGADGRVYFVEELLSRPLDRVAPLRSGESFLRIARDLCRGLQCLHHSGLIHRDIKLDNCGLDSAGRAKIFDLGAVTSDGGAVRGTIFTRAPELMEGEPELMEGEQVHTKACDVWALGATLFALRTGKYPFVETHEVKEREEMACKARKGEMGPEDEEKKRKMDRTIRARYARGITSLKSDVVDACPGEPGQILCEMLDFDSGARPSAEQCAEKWEALLRAWISRSTRLVESPGNLLQSLRGYLSAVRDGQISITNKQWDAVISAWERKEVKEQHGTELGGVIYSLIEEVNKKYRLSEPTVGG